MNKPRFLELVKNPELLEFFDLEKLEEVVASFPYFQAAHFLIAKIAKDQSSIFAAEKLNTVAAFTLDRKNLKKLMQVKPRLLTVYVNNHSDSEVLSPKDKEPNNSEPTTTILSLPKYEEPKLLELHPAADTAVTEDVSNDIKDTDVQNILVSETENNDNNLVDSASDAIASEDFVNTITTDTEAKEDTATNEIENTVAVETIEEITVQPIVEEPATPQENNENLTGQETVKTDVYTELAQNLEELRQLKNQAITEEFLPSIPQQLPETIASNIIDNVDNVDNDENSIALEVAPPKLEVSRLEQILLSDMENKNKLAESDLLIAYFEYLSKKRKEKLTQNKKSTHLIDKFIENEPVIPKLKRNQTEDPIVDLSVTSTQPKLAIVSENFAKILVLQGKYEKAIEMYQQLSLKNPEKLVYFANLINDIKNKYNK
jgi:tetratricopeptide (TPR) repeat protein